MLIVLLGYRDKVEGVDKPPDACTPGYNLNGNKMKMGEVKLL